MNRLSTGIAAMAALGVCLGLRQFWSRYFQKAHPHW